MNEILGGNNADGCVQNNCTKDAPDNTKNCVQNNCGCSTGGSSTPKYYW